MLRITFRLELLRSALLRHPLDMHRSKTLRPTERDARGRDTAMTDKMIVRNNLASSDYGSLQPNLTGTRNAAEQFDFWKGQGQSGKGG